MVSEALDGLTDDQLADLELQESGLVSGQNQGAIASTPFGRRMNPQPSAQPAPEPEAPVALSEYELNKLEEENYRRTDYVMTPQEFDQYWDRREQEDNEVGRFIDGIGQGAAGLLGMLPEAGKEISGALIRGVQDPIGQAKQNIQTGAEIIRKGGINLVQLFDWVSNKVDDLATSSKRAEAINAGIRAQLEADGRFTGDRTQDEQIYQAALAEARAAGAYKPTAEQVQEDRGKAYERYVREKALERDFANVTQFRTGESQMSAPTSAETYQITDEQPMPTVSTLGSMVVDPVNLVPLGAGALSKARVLRRIANLSEKPLLGVERAASGLADVAERVELGIANRVQDITGLTQKQQAALGAGVAGTAIYVDQATEGGGGLTKAVMMAGGVLPALHYGGGLLRKVGSTAGGAATIVRDAGVGGLGVARAEAASNLAGNAAIPERYRKFFTGYVDGTDSTLKRVAQNADNPEALRRVSRFADRMGATQVARVADDAVSGAVTAGIVGTPFAALQPDAERAGEVMGGILTLGAAGGVVGGAVRRRGAEADADVARMFADVQAVGGNVEAFARLPHATLDRLAAMQGVLAGKVDFVPLTGEEYRMNADIAQNGGEATAGVFLDKDANNRARVFINLDGKTATEAIAPHEIGHAILTSNVLDGQPRADLRNLVNQQYGPEGVEARGREYIARMVDADLRQGVTGEAPTVLTEAEMKAVDGGKTMDDIVAERAKDPAERNRLISERVEEFRQRSIDKGEDAMDWARDEIIAETFASEAPAIDFRAIRRDAMFPRLAESMLSAGGRVLEVFGANLSTTGKLMDNPSVLFRDNPLFQDRIMQKRVREYVRSYDQYLAGLEEAGAKELRGVELARSSKPEDLARSTHVKLRDEGRGVFENDFLFQKPDGTYSLKPQKIITATENARSAQIKTLYDARKFVPVNSQEFGKRKVNGREVIGGPVLPPQFDLFTNFPKHVREFARQMERSREEGGSWDIDYNAIGTGASGRYRVTNLGNVRAIQRETVPYGWIVTKANHLLAASLDLNAFRASAMKAINRGDLGLFNNDMRQVEADLKTYLANHRNGLPGEATIGQQKRDMLNGLIGTGTAVQRTANPLYSDLNPRGSIRTWRVDRLNDAKPTGRTGYFFDYDKINNNRMPSAIPQAGMAMPDAPVRGDRADIPPNPRARQAAFISDRGEVRSTGRATHFETNADLGPDFLAIGAGHLGEDGFFRFGSQSMDNAFGDSPADSYAAAARHNQALYDGGKRPSAMLEEPPGLERPAVRGQAMPDTADTPQPRRYVSMEKFIEEAGDELTEVLPNAYRSIELNDDEFPTHLVSFSDARNSMYRSRVPSKEFFDWLHSDKVMDGLVFDEVYTPATAGEGAGHTRESYQALIDRLRAISLKPGKQKATGGARGQAMPDVADAPPFFLKSTQALDAKIQGKAATPDQVKAILTNPQNGIKAEELKWTGVMQEVERLAKENNGKVPKEALLKYLAEDGAVRLEEVKSSYRAEEQKISAEIDDILLVQMQRAPYSERSAYLKRAKELQDKLDETKGKGFRARYAQYQLSGGENYREVVLAMPAKEAMPYKQWLASQGIDDAAIDAMPRYDREQLIRRHSDLINQAFNESYRSTHFDTPNYIAHMRLNERVDAKGKPGLFIEELQSDRHQAGREHGYKEPFEQWIAYYDAGGTEVPIGYGRSEKQALESIDKNWEGLVKIQTRKRDGVEGVIPDAPFRTSWPLQLFKRALRDAVDSGKEWIGWTTGETQAARYDLSKQIDSISTIQHVDGGRFIDVRKDGRNIYDARYDRSGKITDASDAGTVGKTLADVIGKEMASKVLEVADTAPNKDFRGLDLKVGGEGMKGFYDTMVPKEVAKYVKQWGGQVEKADVATQATIDTPQALETVRYIRGQGGVAAASRSMEQAAKVNSLLAQLERRMSQDRISFADAWTEIPNSTAKNDLKSVLGFRGIKGIASLDEIKPVAVWRVNITPQMREGIKKAGQALFMGGAAAVVAEDQLDQ